ncbi:hypothetical protein WG904_08965 [Pedobacter sp. Du54]|uniref:hypothetical protein n=1 Tax=Pedobacter anseongensis TaxID=3133439 RepID=UPI0030B7DE61
MRIFITVLMLLSCYSSPLYAKKMDMRATTQKFGEKSTNFNKKYRNSLKTEFFLHQLDFLYPTNQNHPLFPDHFGIVDKEALLYSTEIDFNHSIHKEFNCVFNFQYLYPKHSFW